LRVHYKEEEENDYSEYPALSTALEHLDRITDLSIAVNSSYRSIVGFEHPAPILRRFSLTVNHGAPIVPMGTLFSGIAPHLRHLSLSGGCFDWHSPLFRNLTALELQNIYVRPHMVANSMKEFLDLLTRMPKLKELHLCHALPDRRAVDLRSPLSTDHISHLPSLTTLHIRDSLPATILEFLSHIVVANGTRGIALKLVFVVISTRDLSRPLLASIVIVFAAFEFPPS
jgi:hypothetical protein